MKDEDKTKKQLIKELTEARNRIANWEASANGRSEADRKQGKGPARPGTSQRADDEKAESAAALTAAEEKAEEEHARSEAIVAAIGAGIGILDRDFRILYQNQAHRDIMGGHVGEYCYQAFHAQDQVCESCPVAMTFEDGNIHTVERTVPGDAGERYIEVTTSPLKDRTGTIVASIEVVTNITGRKLVENSRAILREAIESLPIGITITDLDGKVVYMNPAEAEIHGYTAMELIGKDARMLAPQNTWEPLSFEELYAMGLRKRESVNIRKDGEVFPVQLISRAVTNAQGTPIGIITACEDITARNEAEEKLRNAQRMEVIGKLAGGVAHEVRNPLNAIMAISEALSRDLGENPEYKPYLEHIHGQVERLSVLMRDMLDLGKPIDQFQFHELPLADICSASIDIWKHSRSGGGREAHLVQPEGDNDVIVRADSHRLQQVFVNLLDNAAQHSAEDTDIEMILARPKSGTCGVRVVDRGSGIPKEYLPRIFEPFFSMRKGGTGLGMSIVKHIVETHGGAVEVKNNDPPPGCTVVVRLPERKKERHEAEHSDR